MITYLYWATVIAVAIILGLAVNRFTHWRAGLITAGLILFAAWIAYYFKYEQLFVKNYGGIMSISTPQGHMHLSSTWKDDHLWVESYDPEDNKCYFTEYSKGHILQGRVVIANCNPMSSSPITP